MTIIIFEVPRASEWRLPGLKFLLDMGTTLSQILLEKIYNSKSRDLRELRSRNQAICSGCEKMDCTIRKKKYMNACCYQVTSGVDGDIFGILNFLHCKKKTDLHEEKDLEYVCEIKEKLTKTAHLVEEELQKLIESIINLASQQCCRQLVHGLANQLKDATLSGRCCRIVLSRYYNKFQVV